MKRKAYPFLRAGALAAIFASGTAAQSTRPASRPAPTTDPATSLGVGDFAPSLRVAGWVKGTPVATFTPGQAYVVEFWATSCAPCKKSIPELTSLARQFKDRVTFIGVSVWEEPGEQTDAATESLVRRFVTGMGDAMDYRVAYDGVDAAMSTHWLNAAGRDWIPVTFVIDGTGRIAWIGHPAQLGPVLTKVLAGAWSVAEEKKRIAAATTATAAINAAVAEVHKAWEAHDYPAVVAAIDSAQARFPGILVSTKIEALSRLSGEKTLAYVRTLTAAGSYMADHPEYVGMIMRAVPNVPKDGLMTQAHWKSLVNIVDPLIAPGTDPNAELYENYAEALRRAGDPDSAVFYQIKAVNLTSARNAKHSDEAKRTDKGD